MMKFLKSVLMVAIFTGLVSFSFAQDTATKKENAATKPVPRDKNWEKRHDAFVDIAKRGGVEVLFLGDSITDAWGGEGHNKGSGAKIFESKFVPMKAANFGIGGDRTQHVLWRLQNGELQNIKPKVVMLMIGTNNSNGMDNTAEEIADGVKSIVAEFKKQSPTSKILLLAVFPRNTGKDDAAKKTQKDKIDQINKIIATLDDKKTVKFMDIGGKFLDASGSIPKDIMPDQLHLSEKGYEIWANAVEGVITSMLKGDQTKAVEPAKTVKKVEPTTPAKPVTNTPEPAKTVKKVEPTTPAKPVTGTPEPAKTVKKVEPTPAPKTPEPVKETKKVEILPAVKAPAKASATVVKEEIVEVKKSPIRDFFRKLFNR